MFCGDPCGKSPAEVAHPSCPRCGALYIKWLNYGEFKDIGMRRDDGT